MAISIDLSGKNALVTGGTRGIGRAISQKLAEAGASTPAVYHTDSDSAQTSLSERQAFGNGLHRNYQADVADAEQIANLARQIGADFEGPLDILILNVGVGAQAKVTEISPDDWRRVLETNLSSAFLLTRALLPMMGRGGCIISIGAGLGHQAASGWAAYGASKAGLILFTQALAQEVGPDGIRANVVSPGLIETDFGDLTKSEDFKQRIADKTPLRRVGMPDDVAGVVLFLCSDLAAFVSGQAIRVDGGEV